MQRQRQTQEPDHITLGQRRGIFDLARFSLDLAEGRDEQQGAALTRAYPSPPMSGSPPLPPKPTQEAGGRSSEGSQALGQDFYARSTAVHPQDYRPQPPTYPPLGPPMMATQVHQQPLPAPPYGYRGHEDHTARHSPFMSHASHGIHHPHYQPMPRPMTQPGPSYPPSAPPGSSDSRGSASPKSQRKTKGHVASACVPCKRAHLRCDAQRPCSRCMSNGKEDTCVDVQHKKRGRPRLRDDKESRFEAGRFAQPIDQSMRRPATLFSPASTSSTPFDDPLRRSQSYRVIKSQPSERAPPRFPEYGSAADANAYPPPLAIPNRAPEPVAFLTMEMEIVNASGPFFEGIGSQQILGRRLGDIVAFEDRGRVAGLQRSMQEERTRKEPNYLPPIFERQDAERILHGLPFSLEVISRFRMDFQDVLTFATSDGQQRQCHIRVGLCKEGSIYFITLLLYSPPRAAPQTAPHPYSRDHPPVFHPQGFSQLTPISASYEQPRPRTGGSPHEASFAARPPGPPRPAPGLSPGPSPPIASYSPSPGMRLERAGEASYSVPRSELGDPGRAPKFDYQLPPIRHHEQPDSSRPRERSGRVDIGGLIDKPDPQ